MATLKKPLVVVSIFLAFIAWGVFFPGLTNGSILLETADLGDVAVGSTSAIPLHITNTGGSTLILYFRYENYSCNFSLPRQEILLQPGKTVDVEIRWTPSEVGICSDILHVIYGRDLSETVLVRGRAVEAGGPDQEPDKDVNRRIVIGECDTGVVDRFYEGKLISELIRGCADGVKNHGQFVRCIADLTNDLKKNGVISGKDKRRLQSSAAQANIIR
ncbi:hypothetical protein ES703_115844 [subsurface metagenome]